MKKQELLEEMKPLTNGGVSLISSKVVATFDDVKVSPLKTIESDSVVEDKKDEVTDNIVEEDKKEDADIKDEVSGTINLEKYSVTGFAENVVSDKVVPASVIDENSLDYVKVTNEVELADALRKGSKVKVIEIMNDLDLGWNEIDSQAKKAPFAQNIAPLTHPTLKKTGVSRITVESFNDLTIFSKNGSTIKHAGFVFKNSKNVVVRNLQFDELWEWDESTKGDYDRNDWDYLTLEGCNGVWIDHCTFGKAYDGIVDSKKGTKGVTISYSKFLPGDYKNNGFFTAMFDEMEKNPANYPMYSTIKKQGLSKKDIMRVASPQKKTHLIGAKELDMSKAITAAGYHFGLTSNGVLSTEGGALYMETYHIEVIVILRKVHYLQNRLLL
ncbi:MAG: hypothetical protein E7214_13960 [Clostridium sp.]|nr:hypothetical protein [Clostridium sp.]